MTEQRKQLEQIRECVKGHEPGPWEWDKNATDNVYIDLGAPCSYDGWPVLEAEDYYVCVSDANARLIAAAPDLLRIATEAEAEITRLRKHIKRLLYACYEAKVTGVVINEAKEAIRDE